ncbi:Hemolymph clottable protein-like 2 [Homarus americanus]|uniref:Hemolymph clottable protein-like 2 n=1 Tax=Homarus americanus TaxID=6706 RepID=A0A8J5JD80_HOMAM|nr:Hemolymph clottable protein-like 2 [Homarus americanus]
MDQYSGAGIKADVTVQVTSERKTFFQFSNIQVGEFHDKLECDTRSPLPIQYHPLEQGKDLLEMPFEVSFTQPEGTEFLNAPEEPVWITNIRKSVVNIFRIPPVMITYGKGQQAFKKPTFFENELGMAGRCRNWYSLICIPQEQTVMEEHQREAVIEQDIQRHYMTGGISAAKKSVSKGSKKGAKSSKRIGRYRNLHPIHETLWSLTRTIDYDSCDKEELVAMKFHGNSKTDSSIRRTSIGTYLVRGDQPGARIERAVIEGSVSVFTSDKQHEHFDTFTNQTLELRGVRTIETEMNVEYQSHSHYFQYEVHHRLTDLRERGDETHPNLEQAVTGVPITSQLITEIKEMIVSGLKTVASRMSTTPHSTQPLVRELSILVEAVATLTRQEIDSVYSMITQDELYDKKTRIFYEILMTAGTEPTINYLIEAMDDQTIRQDFYSVFITFFEKIQTTMKSSFSIPKLMEVVNKLTWDNEERYIKSIALLNFAKLAHQVCLSPDKWHSFGDDSCVPDHSCSPDLILNDFLPILVQGLQDTDSPTWKRLVYLQALANLGTPQIIDVLKHIILGDTESHLALRMNACFSLSSTNLPETAHSTVFDLLMPVFENIGENYEVRNIAFLTMVMWQPSVNWWERMAVSTWHEPSSQVANFISTTITSLANGKHPLSMSASRVVHLAKPPTTLSLTHSSMTYLSEYLHNCETNSRISFGWLANTQGFFPNKILFYLQMNTFFGFTSEYKATLDQQNLDEVWRKFYNYFYIEKHHAGQYRGGAFQIVQQLYIELKEQLGVETSLPSSDINLWFRIGEAFYSAENQENDGNFPLDISFIKEALPILSNLPHIQRSVDYTEVLPTDLGLPFFVQYTQQSAYWFNWKVTDMEADMRIKKFKGDLSLLLDTIQGKTLLPWSQMNFAVGAGLHNMLSVTVPIVLSGILDMRKQEIQLTVEPLNNNKVQLVDSHNYPYTVLAGPFPTTVYTQQHQYMTIKNTDPEVFSRRTQALPSVVGLSVESSWSADFEFPINFASIHRRDFDLFTPAYKLWEYSLELNPETSSTRTITTTFGYVTMQRAERLMEQVDEGEFGQESQGSDYSQMSQDYQDYQESEQVENIDNRERIARIQQQVMPGGYVQSISVGVALQGSISRSYESVLTWNTSPITSPQSSTKIQLSLLQHTPLGVLEESHATCVNLRVVKLFFLPMATTEEVLSANFHTTVDAEVYDGVNCDDQPVLKIQGVLDVSEKKLEHIREKLSHQDCNRESENLLPIDIITSPLYDHANIKAYWNENFPNTLMNLTYFVDDIIRGVLFPYVSLDHTARNPENQIEIDATKTLDTNRWTVRTTKAEEVSIIKDLKPPALIEEFGGPARLADTFDYSVIRGRTPSVCVIEDTQVRTLDGTVFSHQPDACWTTASIFHADPEDPEAMEGALMVRHTDQWEVRIVWPWRGLQLDLTKTQLLVNQRPYEERDKTYEFIRLSDAGLLLFADGCFIKVSDKVEILDPQVLRGKIEGLCGKMDGEKSNDLVGPKGCIYTNLTLFALSWTTPSQDCDVFALQSKKDEVELFQKTCSRESYIPTGVSHADVVYDCTEWLYQEKIFGNYKCKSMVPTPFCKPECEATENITKPIAYDCVWSEERVLQLGSTDKACYPHTYVTNYPASCVPH